MTDEVVAEKAVEVVVKNGVSDAEVTAEGFWAHLETLSAEELAKVKAWIEAKI